MLYKNSLKLIFSNFSLVWKLLIYILCATVFCFGLCYVCSIPTLNLLRAEGWFSLIKNAYEEFVVSFSFSGFSANIVEIYEKFMLIIGSNFKQIWFSLIMFCFVLIVLFSFVAGFIYMPMCGVLYHSMSSNTKTSLTENFIIHFKRNLKYSLLNTFVGLPLNLIIFYIIIKGMVLISKLSSDLLFLAPAFAILAFVVLFALKLKLVSAWVPSQIVMEYKPFFALKTSFKSVKKRFGRDFSNALGLILTIVFINMFSLVCTFGIGLIISLPISYVWCSTFCMTSYYTSNGLRYYVDSYNVISPQKRELSENVSSLRNFL